MTEPPRIESPEQALARRRFFVLAVLRFSGVALAMLGIAMMMERIPALAGEMGRYAGLVLALAGAFDVIVLPVLLARRWKSGDRAA